MKLSLIPFALLIGGCGGSAIDAAVSYVVPSVAAQSVMPRTETLHFILRPDANGRWYIQDDADHMPIGVSPTVEQGPDFVRVFFVRSFTHAVSVQITSDDDFGTRITGHSNLGLNSATIRVLAGGQQIDPAKIWSYTPRNSGNFWGTIVMANK